MKSFLQRVTEDILRKHGADLSNVVVVFSNKRASLFMNQHLIDIVDKPLFSPQYMTMSELFHSKSTLAVADNIRAICTLYNVYQQIVPSDETIDAFWGWGEILLNDFNDIDKHMGNVQAILSNVRDLHAYDTINYLSEKDKEMLKRFFSEFTDEHDTRLKERFRNLWNKLLDIYHGLNEALREKSLTYEGAMYREVALHAKDIDWGNKKYIFVGFNMLWETEQQLFLALKEKGQAYFYWDFDYFYTSDTTQEAGLYLRQWLQKYPNELDAADNDIYSNLSSPKDITYLSAPSEDIQAQYAGEWLKKAERRSAGEKTAIVLADESLLKSVVRHLPQEASVEVNIAMGLPLSDTLATTFIDNFLRLHIYNFNAPQQAFVLRQVKILLNHPYTALLIGEEDDLSTVVESQSFVVEAEALCRKEASSLLFSPIDVNSKEVNKMLVERMINLMSNIGTALEQERVRECAEKGISPESAPITYEEQMKQESVYRMYTLLNPLYDILSKEELTIVPATLLRLIDQMIAQTKMPFHGEPIAGLQITGIPETRNLDFDHILVLSCNEGNMPRGVRTSSFIPYVVRKAHGLTTPEERVAVEAYSFYHLVQRCGDISFTFNSSTEEGKTGQMSRFMLQLMADEQSSCHPRQEILSSEQIPYNIATNKVEKTPEVMKILNAVTSLSPSAINTYLRCPMQYYYKYVAGITEPDSDTFDDNRAFGNIFHLAAENIYEEMKNAEDIVSREAIERVLYKDKQSSIQQCVERAISHEVFNDKTPHYDGLLLIMRDVIIHYLRLLLSSDLDSAPLYIKGLEKGIYSIVPVIIDSRERSIEVGGIIDRLDSITTDEGQEVLRVVDYKTGSTTIGTFSGVEEIFDPAKIESHSDYFLQAMLYALFVRHSQQPYSHRGHQYPPLNITNSAVQPAVIFVKKKESREEPVLKLGAGKNKRPISDIADHEKEFYIGLQRVITDILSAEKPFIPTPHAKRCDTCAFLRMCRGNSPTSPEETS